MDNGLLLAKEYATSLPCCSCYLCSTTVLLPLICIHMTLSNCIAVHSFACISIALDSIHHKLVSMNDCGEVYTPICVEKMLPCAPMIVSGASLSQL